MLFKSKNESWLFIDPVELFKIGESLTIHENKHEDFRISVYEMPVKYDNLVKINKLLRELLRENETQIKAVYGI